MITDDMAGVLAEEAFDAFAELLASLNIDLLHTVFTRFEIAWTFKGRNFHRFLVVIRNVGYEVADNRKSTERGDGNRLVFGDRKSTRLNSSHVSESRMPSSA